MGYRNHKNPTIRAESYYNYPRFKQCDLTGFSSFFFAELLILEFIYNL